MTAEQSSPETDSLICSTAWDDPLPHAHSPMKNYLSQPRKGHTKAVVILMHGRDDYIDDMAGLFLPVLQKRYGGIGSGISSDNENEGEDMDDCKVSVIGIEARDNSWYPESHNASLEYRLENNEPYQYAALEKIRQTILFACEETLLPPANIILIGFSQGANLSNTYVKAGLDELQRHQGQPTTVPLPGQILALSGSHFKVQPHFPRRGYMSEAHAQQLQVQEEEMHNKLKALPRSSKILDRLLCGTADPYFPQTEIEEAARRLADVAKQVQDWVDVQISVRMEPGAPHRITDRMLAATIEAIDAVLG